MKPSETTILSILSRLFANLVWLFPAYRDAIDEIHRLHAENAALRFELTRVGSLDPVKMVLDYHEKMLVEQPFPEGKVPDHYWLSPVEEKTSA